MNPKERIAITGMGTMGGGIAEGLLTSGFEVACVDLDELVPQSLRKLKEDGKLGWKTGRGFFGY